MNNKYTEEEIELIKKLSGTHTLSQVSFIIKRNIKYLSKKSKELNINFVKNKSVLANESYLKDLISKSINFSEVLLNANLSDGGSKNTLKKYIKLYNIDTSHFRKKVFSGKKPLNHFLQKDFYNKDIKKRLLKEGIKQNKCEECGITDWRGKPLTFHLDHINGDKKDNRLENLRILCPNCHQQTDTWGGKNIKRDSLKRIIKSKPNNKKITLKIKPKLKKIVRKVERPSLEVLIKEINEMNYCGVARKYGVSDNAIRKWIKSENLNPKDYGFKRGEWAKEKQYVNS